MVRLATTDTVAVRTSRQTIRKTTTRKTPYGSVSTSKQLNTLRTYVYISKLALEYVYIISKPILSLPKTTEFLFERNRFGERETIINCGNVYFFSFSPHIRVDATATDVLMRHVRFNNATACFLIANVWNPVGRGETAANKTTTMMSRTYIYTRCVTRT